MIMSRKKRFITQMEDELYFSKEGEAFELFRRIISKSATAQGDLDADYRGWLANPAKTSLLKEICKAETGRNLDDIGPDFEAFAAIDSAANRVLGEMRPVGRIPGEHLFAAMETDLGWLMSVQADRAGYQCSPKERYDNLEDYETLEVVIRRPQGELCDPTNMGLPKEISDKFTSIEDGGPAIGCNLTWDEIDLVGEQLMRAGQNPNLGVPPGSVLWREAVLYHGTDRESAEDIVGRKVDMAKCGAGYFGTAFYATDNESLARSNYAEFRDEDEEAAVVKIALVIGARVLDLRNPQDSERWSEVSRFVDQKDCYRTFVRRGIDAVVDRSTGGIAIYNPLAVRVIGIVEPAKDLTNEPS